MTIQVFEVGPFAENTYLMMEEGHALLLDPGFSTESEYNRFRDALEKSGSTLDHILLTHAHVDHALGLSRVLRDADVPVWLNDSDYTLWNQFEQQSAMFGIRTSGFDFTPRVLSEKEGFQSGPFQFQVLYTPGHSPDHVSLYHKDEGVLFGGDALFKGSIGRTDLYKGSFEVLETSIREKLYTLPDETRVLPGHGPETTIGEEKQSNAFVRGV
ncbi:MAG: MBL fold metallo-hydrolase [Balneolaceae bacterium]